MNITIFSRKGCHLCDRAIKDLRSLQHEYDFSMYEVDIDLDRAAFERFKDMIPVVEMDGKIIAAGRINRNALKALFMEASQLR